MTNNTSLHFSIAIGHINNLPGSQFNPRNPRKSGADNVGFGVFFHFSGKVKSDGISGTWGRVFGRFDRLNHGRIIKAIVLDWGHDPGPQNRPFCQPFTRRHFPKFSVWIPKIFISLGKISHDNFTVFTKVFQVITLKRSLTLGLFEQSGIFKEKFVENLSLSKEKYGVAFQIWILSWKSVLLFRNDKTLLLSGLVSSPISWQLTGGHITFLYSVRRITCHSPRHINTRCATIQSCLTAAAVALKAAVENQKGWIYLDKKMWHMIKFHFRKRNEPCIWKWHDIETQWVWSFRKKLI